MTPERETPAADEQRGSKADEEKSLVSERNIDRSANLCNQKKPAEFLQWFRPGGPWVITTIIPDGRITTRTFTKDQVDLMDQFVTKADGRENLYFHVNSTGDRRLTKKAQKEEIVEAEWLHVDVDPTTDMFDAERARILKKLQEHVPKPNLILDSGGGYQAFWRLSTPQKAIDGDWAEFERHNRHVETLLDADHCHNVDRIMRLPGTMNLPNKKKIKKGRKERRSSIVHMDADAYELDVFPQAPALGGTDLGDPGRVSRLPADLPSVDLDGLLIEDWCRALILHGKDPNDPDRYDSRSEALWAALCHMAKKDIDGVTMAAVVLNPDLEISGHLLDQKNPEAAALRQIQRAIDRASIEFEVNKAGAPIKSYQNTRLAIVRLSITTEHDNFTDRHILGGHVLQQWAGEVTDAACVALRDLIIKEFAFDPGRNNVHDAVQGLCIENPVEPVVDMLSSLKWDGKSRLDSWLVRLMGADDTPYVRAVGRLILRGMVERAREPGCKFDYIPVLEGSQGTGKSTALRILCGEDAWFCDERLLAHKDKDRAELVQGTWVFELSELAGIRKTDVEDLKSYASRQADSYRPAYGRHKVTQKRRFILIGTTNNDDYLRDPTGERRFLPVRTSNIDLAGLKEERDQLFAEACSMKGNLVLPHEVWGSARAEQVARRMPDPWEDVIADAPPEATWGGKSRSSSAWLLSDVLKIEPGRQNSTHLRKLGPVMRSLCWTGPCTLRVSQNDKNPVKGYWRDVDVTDEPEKEIPF